MNWKRQWLNELERQAPKAEQLNITPNGGGTAALKKKAGITAVSCFALVAIVLTVFLCLWFCVFNQTTDVFSGNFVTVEINPSVILSLDENGKVIKAVSLNDDADVILSDESAQGEIVGKDLKTAVNAYVDYAAKLGYVDLLSDAVKIYGTDKDTVDNAVRSLQNYLKKDGIFAVVVNGGVDIEKIAQNCSAENVTLADVANSVKKLNSLNIENATVNLTLEELIDEYKSKILQDKTIKEYIKNLICSEENVFLSDTQKDLVKLLIENNENFFEAIDDIINQLETACPEIAENINAIINFPKNRDEFISKVIGAAKINFDINIKSNKEKYDLPRHEISDEDYELFMNGIIETYGSLENFWAKKSAK